MINYQSINSTVDAKLSIEMAVTLILRDCNTDNPCYWVLIEIQLIIATYDYSVRSEWIITRRGRRRWSMLSRPIMNVKVHFMARSLSLTMYSHLFNWYDKSLRNNPRTSEGSRGSSKMSTGLDPYGILKESWRISKNGHTVHDVKQKKIFVDFSRRFESVRNWKPPAISEAFFCHSLKRFLWFETFRCRKKKKKVRTSRSWLFFYYQDSVATISLYVSPFALPRWAK